MFLCFDSGIARTTVYGPVRSRGGQFQLKKIKQNTIVLIHDDHFGYVQITMQDVQKGISAMRILGPSMC